VLEWWLAQRAQRKVRQVNEAKLIRGAPRESERYEQTIRFLLDRGLDEYAVRVGSIPEDSLEFVSRVAREQMSHQTPVRALHIGNFLGISLCHLSWLVQELHPASIIVSIDPNQPHLGIEDPESHARALLEHFGLLSTNLIIRGYTMAGSPAPGGRAPLASENVLRALKPLCPRRFNFVLIDGNHDESYLFKEFSALRELLADQSIVVFDDVADFDGVSRVFGQTLQDGSLTPLGQDGRVGIVQTQVAERAPA
jgi:predicted O-methyltransferase YrrM